MKSINCLENVKMLIALLAVSSFMVLTGCEQESDVGGPGAKDPGPGVSEHESANTENTFVLTGPDGEVDITQGETENFMIGIERGDDFSQTVNVVLKAPAEGLTIQPAEPVFSGDQAEIEVTLTAAADAPVGETMITMIGNPESGESVNMGITIRVNDDE